jgi:hypothetical protein
MRQAPRSPLSFKLQRVANVSEHPPPSTRLMSCAHIANRQLSRIIGARFLSTLLGAENFDQTEHAVSRRHDPLHQLPLLEKDAHVHLAVHCRRGGQILLGLLWLAAAAIELAQA